MSPTKPRPLPAVLLVGGLVVAACGDFEYEDPNGTGGLSRPTGAAPAGGGGSRSGPGTGADAGGPTSPGSGLVGTTTLVARDDDGHGSLAVYGEDIYVANLERGTIKKVALSGGSLTLVAKARAAAIVATPQGVYWVTSGSSGAVYRLAYGATSPTTLAAGLAYPDDLVVTPFYAFIALATSIVRNSPPGGVVTPVASGQQSPKGLSTDGPRIYWGTADGKVMSASSSGSDVRTLATGLTTPWDIAVDASAVYVAERTSRRIAKLPKSGSSVVPTYLASAETDIMSVAVSGGFVYWGTSGGVVARVATRGGTVQTVARDQKDPTSLTPMSDGIVWYSATGAIMRMRE